MGPSECLACGGALLPWRDVRAGEPSDTRRYPLRRCADCGSAFTNGEPPSPSAYEAGIYAPGEPRGGPAVRALQRAVARQPVRMLREGGLEPGARVLDAGAGRGRLVTALRSAGYDATGIDTSERSVALAQSAGTPVEARAIAEHRDERLDAVVLWHVLEHLERPHEALTRVAGWLRPGGRLLIGVPNIGSLQARIGGDAWLHLDAPRHRSHFTPGGLAQLLDRAGFEAPAVRHLVWEHNVHGMWLALLGRMGMQPNLPFHLVKRNARARPADLPALLAGAPLLPVTLALELAAARAGRGGTVAALARLPVHVA